MRKITVNEVEYNWQVGAGKLIIRSPKNKHVYDIPKLLGITWDSYERSIHKHTVTPITPKFVRELILERNL